MSSVLVAQNGTGPDESGARSGATCETHSPLSGGARPASRRLRTGASAFQTTHPVHSQLTAPRAERACAREIHICEISLQALIGTDLQALIGTHLARLLG